MLLGSNVVQRVSFTRSAPRERLTGLEEWKRKNEGRRDLMDLFISIHSLVNLWIYDCTVEEAPKE